MTDDICIMEKGIPRDAGRLPEYAMSILVCIDEISNGIAWGHIWLFCMEKPIAFNGLGNLLLLIDLILDKMGQPARWFELRTIMPGKMKDSEYSPLDYYKKIMGGGWAFQTDKYEQLLRRLTLVIQITEESIQAVRYNIQGKKFLPIPETVRPNTYWQEAKKNKDESITLFNSFFDDATPNISESDEPCEQMRIPE